jgi:hypothetical protein
MKEFQGPDSTLHMSDQGGSTKIFLLAFWTIFISGLPSLEIVLMRQRNF